MKIDAINIRKTFSNRDPFLGRTGVTTVAVKNFSLSLGKGERLGVVGESGSGKTTVAKMLAGFLDPDSGSILFNGTDVQRIDRRKRAEFVQMTFQDPFASLNPKLLLETQLLEGLRLAGARDINQRARELMTDVGLSVDFLKRYPHQLSGGQRQRFAVARALTRSPQLLIADEPVSSLDLSVQAQMINLLNQLHQRQHFSLIVISHDLAVIANLCENVLVMKDGEIMEQGNVHQILNAPSHPYTLQLLKATPVV